MTQRDDTVSVRQMLDHAVEAVEMARGRSRADLDGNRQLNLALVYALTLRMKPPMPSAALCTAPLT